MFKDWKRHKAEVEQLYVAEGKTLEEVRGILKGRYGFMASTRAYRMRLDDWGLRKYKPSKSSQASKLKSMRPASIPIIIEPSTSSPDHAHRGMVVFPDGISIPVKLLEASELRQLVPVDSIYTLEIFLLKWQNGGDYFQTITTLFSRDTLWRYLCNPNFVQTPRRNLFNLIQRRVADDEQVPLVKAIFEGLALVPLAPWSMPDNPSKPAWIDAFFRAISKTEWLEAKRCLGNDALSKGVKCNKFLQCAIVVVAEQLLRLLKGRLSLYWQEYNIDPGLTLAKSYLAIMRDLEIMQIDVELSFYKYPLEL